MASSNQKKLILSSSVEELKKIEHFVHELQKWAALDDDQQDQIRLPLNEAVNNAIIHGNKQQKDKKVTVTATLESHRLTISVEDEGEGFDPEAIPHPLKEENLLNKGGRGVYLIKEYTDEVIFLKNGTKVTMHFRITD